MRVVLDLNPGVHPISGTFAHPAVERTVAFRGTLELLALLEAADLRAGDDWQLGQPRGSQHVNGLPSTRPRTMATVLSVSSMPRVVTGAAAFLALLVAAACGNNPAATDDHPSQHSTTDAVRGATPRVAVTYDDRERTTDGPYRAHAVLLAAGPDHIRYEIKSTGYAPMLFVYDGHRLLVHDPEEYRPWSLYEAPEEHPDQFDRLGHVHGPGQRRVREGLQIGEIVGHKRIVGRSAVGFHCAAHFLADGSGTYAFTEWLDQKTNVLLESGHFHATSFDEHPDLTAASFSTQPPAGAKVAVYAARQHAGDAPKKAPDFALSRVTGTGAAPGTVSLSDYTHQPLVLAFFSSDLAFAETRTAPDVWTRCMALTQLTDDGTNPAVLAVQDGEEGKPGYPLIPKGLDVDVVVNDPDSDVQHSYGLSDQVGFAFIGADGKVHQVFNKAPTDQQLKDAVDALQ